MDVSNFKYSESSHAKRDSIWSESTTNLVDVDDLKKESGAVNKNSVSKASYSPKQLSIYNVYSADVEKENGKFDISKASTGFLKMIVTALPSSMPPVTKTDIGLLNDGFDGSQKENDGNEFLDRNFTRRTGKKGVAKSPYFIRTGRGGKTMERKNVFSSDKFYHSGEYVFDHTKNSTDVEENSVSKQNVSKITVKDLVSTIVNKAFALVGSKKSTAARYPNEVKDDDRTSFLSREVVENRMKEISTKWHRKDAFGAVAPAEALVNEAKKNF